jgi:ISXO2-like transposase domain
MSESTSQKYICERETQTAGWEGPLPSRFGTERDRFGEPSRLFMGGMARYQHEVSKLKGQKKSAATELLPRVHRVASLLKGWLLGTHQGAIAPEHLDYYLDEFTFRFNRRTSASRGKLFYRLAQQAVQVPPVPYQMLTSGTNNPKHHR